MKLKIEEIEAYIHKGFMIGRNIVINSESIERGIGKTVTLVNYASRMRIPLIVPSAKSVDYIVKCIMNISDPEVQGKGFGYFVSDRISIYSIHYLEDLTKTNGLTLQFSSGVLFDELEIGKTVNIGFFAGCEFKKGKLYLLRSDKIEFITIVDKPIDFSSLNTTKPPLPIYPGNPSVTATQSLKEANERGRTENVDKHIHNYQSISSTINKSGETCVYRCSKCQDLLSIHTNRKETWE